MSQLSEQAALRADFPALGAQLDGVNITYLDSAASSLKPQLVADAVSQYYLGVSTNVHRGKSQSLESVSNRYEEARYKVAELISCSGNEVVFVKNTTEGINLVANGCQLQSNDLVVTLPSGHHSNLLPWMAKAQVESVELNKQGDIDLLSYIALLDRKPKVVAITACSNVSGVYLDLPLYCKMAKEAGSIVVVDAAQAIAHRKINVHELDIDFMTFSAHKMLGPTGLGILYGRKAALEQLEVTQLGGGMVDWVDEEHYRVRKIPHRFEPGTPHIAGVLGFSAAIEYLNKFGWERVQQHDIELGKLMLEEALARDYLNVIQPDRSLDRGAVLSFSIPKVNSLDDFARTLSDSYGFICRTGHLCAQPFVSQYSDQPVLRISGYIYTTEDDIKAFFAALDELSKFTFL
ncbi:aminotransferase class V-fold PLP-dependent enzyme [Pseudoalteromonas luteoviolacea]|uniref:Aminotransferase class V domain-containing protein n=1 Tax=Pseudoalteromonas luteoviolacea H33 TaxID=1365251 RepID=A0A167DEC5_9GAMM|nr:aminotransferase class V-fold PLP-dependent enzyme [Pseudoalteromonas luteoviolacea]KZN48731.1 hypothetical protein N476_21185 [Pseudoalteromonas luteoviolacea H33]KZN75434.1 hypothetical protein N477_01600 [Pseudoalteromonas luteoviolacea H33-S]MBQ4878633.1 aminotransferase class V-fold PLP-dependent enzyme [Pseudoalteromonas luteoviolacea]MBQ4907173.1 aminotransferase class V-fold PLP-dependent enzyme [Pseudoalteromonas luteoviolacea]